MLRGTGIGRVIRWNFKMGPGGARVKRWLKKVKDGVSGFSSSINYTYSRGGDLFGGE